MFSYSHWGMFPAGYYMAMPDPFNPGCSRAVFGRTDEEGNEIDMLPQVYHIARGLHASASQEGTSLDQTG